MNLSGRERPRRTNRPRHPTSVMAGLTLTVMALLFVGLLGASGVTWLATMAPRQQVNNNVLFAPQPPVFQPNGGGGGNNAIVNPGPPGPRFNDNLATRIALKNRVFLLRTFLTNNDTLDPVMRWAGVQLPCKVFLVELEEGKKYTIEYTRAAPVNDQFDPYLRIENQEGQRLVEHDDIDPANNPAHNMDSRIEFRPAKTGTYRIFCTLFQHRLPAASPGQWQFTLSIREEGVAALPTVVPMALPPVANIPLPQPRMSNPRPPANPTTDGEIKLTSLANPPGLNQALGEVCWSPDSKAFFALYGSGGNAATLVRVALDGLVEERRLDLGRNSGGMVLSGQGLVVAVPAINEVWLINPDNLQVTKRFGILNAQAVASAPGLNFAYVVSASKIFPPPFANPGPLGDDQVRRGLIVLDLAKNQSARFQDLPCKFPVVSRDGTTLFAMDDDVLNSFAIKEDGQLVPKHTGGRLGFDNKPRRIEVSPDSKYVCVAGSTVNPNLPNHPNVGPCPAFVYPVEDLRKPAFGISTGIALRAVGFDIKANRVFAHADRMPLVEFDAVGNRKAQYTLPNIGLAQEPLQFLTHPDGNKLLIRFQSKICCAVFKPNNAPIVKAAPKFPPPSPVKNAETIAAAPFKRGDATYRELQLPNLGEIEPCWDADGQALFHLEPDGILTRISVGDFMPTTRLVVGRPVSAMALSANGLLVALREQPEIWVIDSRSLEVQRRIVCTSPAKYLASHPKLSVAAAIGAEAVVLDLTGRGAVRGVPVAPEAGQPFQNPALTPDGKYLFLSAGSSKVLRVRIEPERLVVEDTKTTSVKAAHVFCVTAKGDHVAWFSPLTRNKKQETEFYPVADWKAPAFTLPERARAMASAVDGALFIHTHDNKSMVFAEPANRDAKPAPLQSPEGRIRDFVLHPREPGEFLASNDKTVFHGKR